MSRLPRVALRALVLAMLVFAPRAVAVAQNPAWPNASASVTELRDPANWPADSDYGYDISGSGMSCWEAPPMGDDACWANSTGGSWEMWSFVPPQAELLPEFRAEEAAMGSGISVDRAWQHTTGRRDVVIAVLDSGIRWSEGQLTDQFYLSRPELEAAGLDPRCLPTPGEGADPHDRNDDGVLSMNDWFAGLDGAARATLSSEIDAMGNSNGLADPGDLIVLCSDEVDDDGNGYVDDISGWDFMHDDNDPADDTSFGHGTGEARLSVAPANDGGDVGFCPNCRALMVRVADSFIPDAQDYAQAVVFGVDSGAIVVQEALGSLNHTTYMRRANRYAYDHGVLIVASAADENSRHHNFPGTSNHTLYVHAIEHAGPSPQNSFSYLAFSNCTNYGGQLALSVPSGACSSGATGITAGVAGLLHSAARDGALDPPLSVDELRALMTATVDDIDVPESQPDHPEYNELLYPSLPGWDQRFGWGRLNAYRAVKAVVDGRIPPEMSFILPDWFRVVDPDREPTVSIDGRIAASRAESFDYVLEWAPGIEPADDAWSALAMETGRTEPLEGELHAWDVSDLEIDNPGEVENRFTVTLRIRATAHYGDARGDVSADLRRVIAIRRDPSMLAGFPIAMGVRNAQDEHPGASGEASPKLADLDGDDKLEIIVADSDGLLHAFNEDASEVVGFPVQLGRLHGLDAEDTPSYLASDAYATGAISVLDVAPAVVGATPAIGDLDADGSLEVVAGTHEGELYAFHDDGSPVTGFPVGLPEVLSGDVRRGGPTDPDRRIERGIFASPALADLDDDGSLEIVVAALDGHVYVFRADGSPQPGFPVRIIAPALLWPTDPSAAKESRILTSPAIGDANGDGLLDIAVGSNEQGESANQGAIHLIHGDGNLHEGGAEHPNWPIQVFPVAVLVLVGEGLSNSPAMADLNGDGRVEIIVTPTASLMYAFDGIQPARQPGADAATVRIFDGIDRGQLTDLPSGDGLGQSTFPVFSSGSLGDLDGDGVLDFVIGGAGADLARALGASGWERRPFVHRVAAWSSVDTRRAAAMPGFPRAIEDYMFFVTPTIADVSGDAYPEVVVGSGGYYVHAWDACGTEAPGFPKFVGGWVASSTATGDVDGDGKVEVVAHTRNGYLYAFHTEGSAGGAMPWPVARHDARNTGNAGVAVDYGVASAAAAKIDCGIAAPTEDAGVADDAGLNEDVDAGPDAGVAGADAGPASSGDEDGCDCTVVESRETVAGNALLVLLAFAALIRRRKRA